MKDIQHYFDAYAEYHKNPTNQLLHMIGIPMIMFSLFGLLALVQIPVLNNAALVLWSVANIWYFKMSPKLAFIFAPLSLGFYYASLNVPLSILWGIFVVGWISQLWGHKIEGKAPAFLQNLLHVLVGPLWVLVKAFKLKY